MPNYTEFGGVDLITDQTQKVIAKVLVKNELGDVSNDYNTIKNQIQQVSMVSENSSLCEIIRKKVSVFLLIITVLFYSYGAIAEDCFDLSTPLEFGNKVVEKIEIKKICRSDIARLMNLPIYGLNDDGEGISVGNKKYKTCNDGFDNSSDYQYDNVMKNFYNLKCDLLKRLSLGNIKVPKKTYLENFSLSTSEQVSSDLFIPHGFMADQQLENFKQSKDSEQTLDNLVKNGRVKNYQSNKTSISFEYKDAWYLIKEVLRADFNNDEIEDIYVVIDTGINSTTYRSNVNMVLIKESGYDMVREFKNPVPCEDLESKDLYKCLQKQILGS